MYVVRLMNEVGRTAPSDGGGAETVANGVAVKHTA